ncbi:hypothetical protein Efla_006159 [Eimeria flavescens]
MPSESPSPGAPRGPLVLFRLRLKYNSMSSAGGPQGPPSGEGLSTLEAEEAPLPTPTLAAKVSEALGFDTPCSLPCCSYGGDPEGPVDSRGGGPPAASLYFASSGRGAPLDVCWEGPPHAALSGNILRGRGGPPGWG